MILLGTLLRRRREARNSRDDAKILTYLAGHGPAHALAIHNNTGLGTNRIYGCLDRMENDGRVSSHWHPRVAQAGQLRQRLYDVTHERWVSHGPNP